MRVLMIALLLAVSVPAFAEPSKTPKFLIDRKISLFDWGIYKLDQEMSSRVSSRLSSRWTDAELIHGEAEYDWDTNRIWLRVTFFGTAASPESCVAAAKAIKDRFLILIDTDTADDGAILAQAASELSAIFSHPGGYKANSRPDDVGEQLTHITNIEAALFGPIEATNRTQRPDYRCQTTFRSKEVAVIVD